MNKQDKQLSPYDVEQCARYKFDDDLKADRVFVVNSPEIKLSDLKVESNIQTIEVPVIIKETVIERIEIPVIVKEQVIERVEIPTVTEIVKIVEVPKVVIQHEIKEVQVPLIIKDLEKFPLWLKVCLLTQSFALIGLLVVNVIKK